VSLAFNREPLTNQTLKLYDQTISKGSNS